jgi:F0F1-type ATP synthase membrane subunit b/b'
MLLDPLAQLDAFTVAAAVAVVLATAWVLRRIFFAPLLAVMERRASRIEAARARRVDAERALADARVRAERVFAAAREEAARVADAARDDAQRARAARLAEAGREADALLSVGRDEALALRRAEEARLAEELCACVCQALARMVGRVDEPLVRFLVSRALAATERG